MPVLTLTLTWDYLAILPSAQGGWKIELCGNIDMVDLSPYKFVRKRTAPYQGIRDPNGRLIGNIGGIGTMGWVLTPDEEPLLGIKSGALRHTLPMGNVTLVLQALEDMGFKVLASHSILTDVNVTVSQWTLSNIC